MPILPPFRSLYNFVNEKKTLDKEEKNHKISNKNYELIQKEEELDIWDKPLSIKGVELWLHREKKMNQFAQFFSEVVERFDKNLLLDINYKLKTQKNVGEHRLQQ